MTRQLNERDARKAEQYRQQLDHQKLQRERAIARNFTPFASLPGYWIDKNGNKVLMDLLFMSSDGAVHSHRPGVSYEADEAFLEQFRVYQNPMTGQIARPAREIRLIPRKARRKMWLEEERRYRRIVAARKQKAKNEVGEPGEPCSQGMEQVGG
jgi:hypothetical protein